MKYKILIPICIVLIICAGIGVFIFNKSNIQTAVIWTNQSEFALYAEVFNAAQDKYRVAVIYTENPAQQLAISAKTIKPDIIIGPWLKSEKIRTYFAPLDYLFDEMHLQPSIFYETLLSVGNVKGTQYLLPVSFNLPAVIFSTENQDHIPNDFMLSLDEIQETAGQFNTKNKTGAFTAMGFSPQWDPQFLYIIASLKDTEFHENSNLFSWNADALQEAIQYAQEWTKTHNESFTAENDFKFKYLYNPTDKLVTSGRSLFAYMKSDDIFLLSPDRRQNIDFRWTHENNMIPIDDKMINMGLYKKAPNLEASEAFILWFMSEEGQKEMLRISKKTGMLAKQFGISGGFSSLKKITEGVFPTKEYYPKLLGHLPPSDALKAPHVLPNTWDKIKEKIVIPYMQEAVTSKDPSEAGRLEDRITEWQKLN